MLIVLEVVEVEVVLVMVEVVVVEVMLIVLEVVEVEVVMVGEVVMVSWGRSPPVSEPLW